MDENHVLTIEQCKKITATAITSVDAFSDRQVILSYYGGRIIIAGSGMKITGFSKSGGQFSATGEIVSARYAAKGSSFKQKFFK